LDRGVGRLVRVGIVAVPVVVLAVQGYRFRWVADDGFIYFRVVEQLQAGNGPVFNAGERVEIFTSPLWLAVLTVTDVVAPGRLEWLAVLLGIGLSVAGVVMAILGARLLVRRDVADAVLVPVGVLAFGAIMPVWIFQTSGLENGLVFAWLGACLWVLARWADGVDGVEGAVRPMGAGWGVLLGLGWLVRPELVVFSAVFLVLVLVAQRGAQGWRSRVGFVAAAVAIPVAYQVFRMGYFGMAVSNTAIAKEGTDLRWGRGWAYLRNFADPYWLWLPLLAMVAGAYVPLVRALRARGRAASAWVLLAFLGLGTFSGLYVVAVGGDYLHARLFLPAYFALCAPVAVVALAKRYAIAFAVLPWALAAGLALRPPADPIQVEGDYLFALPTQQGGLVTLEDWGWGEGGEQFSGFGDAEYYYSTQGLGGEWRSPDAPLRPDLPRPYVIDSAMGALGYALGPDVHILDTLGLADAFTSHLATTSEPLGALTPHWLAGHEKPLPNPWLAARVLREGAPFDDEDLPPPSPSGLIPVTEGEELAEQIAWARAALACPAIQRLQEATSDPLTPGRFLSNLAHAADNTRMRIPADPRTAYRRFCGDDTPPEVLAVTGDRATGP
jgi:arabinofuranosyltransferase